MEALDVLDKDDEPQTMTERQAQDPDGAYAWQGGVLTCPVRRHDYRLFEFMRVEK